MFREIRRKNQLLSTEETIKIFERGTSGVLALLGDNDYPYAVPISYVYCDGILFFHGAKTGHKIDAIAKCGKASFCVIDEDNVVPEEYTTFFVALSHLEQSGSLRATKEKEQLSKNWLRNIHLMRRAD